MKKYFKCLTKMQLISFLLLFLTAFLFNYWTPYAADDYSYMKKNTMCVYLDFIGGSAMANGLLPYSKSFHPLPSIICNMAMDVLYHTFL
mgnify:CR=1 FL=1